MSRVLTYMRGGCILEAGERVAAGKEIAAGDGIAYPDYNIIRPGRGRGRRPTAGYFLLVDC